MKARRSPADPASAARWLTTAAVAVLPLACWPSAPRPFSTPKLWVLAGIDILIGARWVALRGKGFALPSWPWLFFIGTVAAAAATAPLLSPGALVLLVLPLPLLLAGIDAPGALCAGSVVESVIVLLQFSGHDPFGWLGWAPEAFGSRRMRVYGTLGNPDFVAAWLSATLPLCMLARPRALRAAVGAVQIAAIFCTGSRVLLAALPAALLAYAIVARRFEKWWLLAVPLLLALAWLSPARSLAATAKGRVRLAAVTAAHLPEVPLTGFGPGTFESRFAAWNPGEGPIDHAHNDYLELWVEYGPLALAAFLVLCASSFWRLSSRGSEAEVAAALASLLAIALVDFPFHRPAGWALFTILAGVNKET